MFDFLDGLFGDHHVGDLFGDDLHTRATSTTTAPTCQGPPGMGMMVGSLLPATTMRPFITTTRARRPWRATGTLRAPRRSPNVEA